MENIEGPHISKPAPVYQNQWNNNHKFNVINSNTNQLEWKDYCLFITQIQTLEFDVRAYEEFLFEEAISETPTIGAVPI